MLASVEGIYRHGKIELGEIPAHIQEETKVIVTFLRPSRLDLAALEINQAEAAQLRSQLSSFRDDWERPEMDVYDDYDAAKANL
jgi:hypothetical protein